MKCWLPGHLNREEQRSRGTCWGRPSLRFLVMACFSAVVKVQKTLTHNNQFCRSFKLKKEEYKVIKMQLHLLEAHDIHDLYLSPQQSPMVLPISPPMHVDQTCVNT